jgi:hypothetical protein
MIPMFGTQIHEREAYRALFAFGGTLTDLDPAQVRVHHCDEERQLVFGTLDNEPVVNAEDLRLGEELAISYRKVREHRKPWEFHKN